MNDSSDHSRAGSPSASSAQELTIGQCATMACLLEVAAPKPGNVHRGADFEDVTFVDFAAGAVGLGPVFDRAISRSLGETVRDAVHYSRWLASSNTHLGTILLLAPLAQVPRSQSLSQGITAVLQRLRDQDARDIYEAIRLANPGGLGTADDMDVAGPPPSNLLLAMQAAADRDLVARQYGNGFEQVLQGVVPFLTQGLKKGWPLMDTIIHAHLQMMAEFPDSLIARKLGSDTARRAAGIARSILALGGPGHPEYYQGVADLDFWLRSDGHRRNPGTTADFIAAGLFVGLRDGWILPPFR